MSTSSSESSDSMDVFNDNQLPPGEKNEGLNLNSVQVKVPPTSEHHAAILISFTKFWYDILSLPRDSVQMLEFLNNNPKLKKAYCEDLAHMDEQKYVEWEKRTGDPSEMMIREIQVLANSGKGYVHYMGRSMQAKKIGLDSVYPLVEKAAKIQGRKLRFDSERVPYYIDDNQKVTPFTSELCCEDLRFILNKLEKGSQMTAKGCEMHNLGSYLICGALISSSKYIVRNTNFFKVIFSRTLYNSFLKYEKMKKDGASVGKLSREFVFDGARLIESRQINSMVRQLRTGQVSAGTKVKTITQDGVTLDSKVTFPQAIQVMSYFNLSPKSMANAPKEETRKHKFFRVHDDHVYWDGNFENVSAENWKLPELPDGDKVLLDLTRFQSKKRGPMKMYSRIMKKYIRKMGECNNDPEKVFPRIVVVFSHTLCSLVLNNNLLAKDLKVLDVHKGIFSIVLTPQEVDGQFYISRVGFLTPAFYPRLMYEWLRAVKVSMSHLKGLLEQGNKYVFVPNPEHIDEGVIESSLALKKSKAQEFELGKDYINLNEVTEAVSQFMFEAFDDDSEEF